MLKNERKSAFASPSPYTNRVCSAAHFSLRPAPHQGSNRRHPELSKNNAIPQFGASRGPSPEPRVPAYAKPPRRGALFPHFANVVGEKRKRLWLRRAIDHV
jgi:hypothetical protein